MLIVGRWLRCEDGVERPVIEANLPAADGSLRRVPFLVDTGADRTVLSAGAVQLLGLPPVGEAPSLEGVGGRVTAFLVDPVLHLPLHDGRTAVIRGPFIAVADPAILDMNVLGRDVTNQFALIVDRPGNVVCLLGQQHQYLLQQT